MLNQIKGLHHVTSLASSARENNAFFTKVLGLRRVKKTVNFDAPDVYHLYYADEVGTPGTVTPCTDPPTAHPTTQSSQWLSKSCSSGDCIIWLRRKRSTMTSMLQPVALGICQAYAHEGALQRVLHQEVEHAGGVLEPPVVVADRERHQHRAEHQPRLQGRRQRARVAQDQRQDEHRSPQQERKGERRNEVAEHQLPSQHSNQPCRAGDLQPRDQAVAQRHQRDHGPADQAERGQDRRQQGTEHRHPCRLGPTLHDEGRERLHRPARMAPRAPRGTLSACRSTAAAPGSARA